MIGSEVFPALDGESEKRFHHRLAVIARSKGVYLVSLGSDTPTMESRYNLDGSLDHRQLRQRWQSEHGSSKAISAMTIEPPANPSP